MYHDFTSTIQQSTVHQLNNHLNITRVIKLDIYVYIGDHGS